ncbi:SIMPL domain-containing protein [Hoeflea sp. WL0058]|uniref:SIMPL domain-containing protein n=1 Tax=Flavimaribacter sediminis TaxID=2865987 RepID=A0AAE2ZQ83_9HYPH|nr:SIMPL domain-containing protein [Flavimaribacter sediminis]MBW8638742.1 SIMPL domain-containing protein [Flavimaribacter sediminis]
MSPAKKFLIMFAVALLPVSAMAQAQKPHRQPSISVTGEGSAQVTPDMAVINLTVLRQGKTAREALDASNEAMAAILAEMEATGIEDRDLQTSNFSISPQYIYPTQDDNRRQPPTIEGYNVSNSLTVRIRDLKNLGGVLDKSVTLGVNQGGQILFTSDDPSAAITEARKKAVEDAMEKAQTLAEAAGVELGAVLKISEVANPGRPAPMMRAEMAMASDARGVPVAAGENEYSVSVTMSFKIKD